MADELDVTKIDSGILTGPSGNTTVATGMLSGILTGLSDATMGTVKIDSYIMVGPAAPRRRTAIDVEIYPGVES